MTLYDALGIDKDATIDAVKRAFRGKARKTHPDAGGSADEFALVCRAKDILSDPERRAKYDRTGEEDAGGPDQTEALAMQVAMQALGTVIQTIDQRGGQHSQYDIIADAIRKIENDMAQMSEQARRLTADAKKQRDIAKRFKPKKGKTNRLSIMFENNAGVLERNAEAALQPIEIHEAAIDFLRDHSYSHVNGYG